MFLADHKMEVERLEELRVRFENELDEQDDKLEVYMHILCIANFIKLIFVYYSSSSLLKALETEKKQQSEIIADLNSELEEKKTVNQIKCTVEVHV